jgi:hypothetical protein
MKRIVLSLVFFLLIGFTTESFGKPYILFVLDDQNSFVASRAFNTFRSIYGEDAEWTTEEIMPEEQIQEAPILIYLSERVDEDDKITPSYNLYVGDIHISYEGVSKTNPALDWTDIYYQQAFEVAIQIFKDLNTAMDEPFCKGIGDIIESFSGTEK